MLRRPKFMVDFLGFELVLSEVLWLQDKEDTEESDKNGYDDRDSKEI